MYWRFDEQIQHIELDYPRDLQMWKGKHWLRLCYRLEAEVVIELISGVPYNIDAVFQAPDQKTYFFKEKYFWEFNDKRMEVSAMSPQLVGESWLHCPREMQDPHKKTANSALTIFFSPPNYFLLVKIAFSIFENFLQHSVFISARL